jgi:hypothetical protein
MHWLTICREKDCGWDEFTKNEADASNLRARHEREQPGHRTAIVALDENQYWLIPPARSKEAA